LKVLEKGGGTGKRGKSLSDGSVGGRGGDQRSMWNSKPKKTNSFWGGGGKEGGPLAVLKSG